MQLIERRLTTRIAHSLQTDRVTALMGPRQAGKTTLVRHLLTTDRELQYYNLKDPAIRRALKENARQEFTHYKKATIILDEVQTLPALLELIQLIVDDDPERKGRFLLLGSNHLLLNRHIRESLAGRVGLFTLLPLSLGEKLQSDGNVLLERLLAATSVEECSETIKQTYLPVKMSQQAQDVLLELNRFGGYPEFLERKKAEDRKDWLSNYHQTYLETDLRQLVELRNVESFELFEQLFGQRVGNLMNLSELSRDCGLSVDTIRRFIGYYRQLFIGWRLKPYFVNAGKRMMKMSKYYLFDTGVLRSVLDDFSSSSGQFFENTVLAEIKKILAVRTGSNRLYFCRTATGVEVDGFLATDSDKISLFLEIKQAAQVQMKDIRHLKKYVRDQPDSLGLLIYNGGQIQQIEHRIWAVPAAWLLV